MFTVPVTFASGMTTDPLVNTADATDLAASGPGQHRERVRQRRAQRGRDARGDEDRRRHDLHAGRHRDLFGHRRRTPAPPMPWTSPSPTRCPRASRLRANATCVANGTSSCGTVTGTTGQTSFGATGATRGRRRREHDRLHGAGRVRARHVDESAGQCGGCHRRSDRRHREWLRQRHAVVQRHAGAHQDRRQRDVHAGRHRDLHGDRREHGLVRRARRDRGRRACPPASRCRRMRPAPPTAHRVAAR